MLFFPRGRENQLALRDLLNDFFLAKALQQCRERLSGDLRNGPRLTSVSKIREAVMPPVCFKQLSTW